MKTRASEMPRPRSRGLRALVFLGASAALALGGLLALASSGRETPARRAAFVDPLTEAKVALVDGKLEAAEKLLRSLAGTEARSLLGRVLLERGRCDESSKVFAELVKEDPKNFEATRGLAATSQRLGRLDLAVLYWMRAVELRKEDARTWRDLGLCQRDKGDTFGALSSLQQSLKLDPGQSGLSGILTELSTGRRQAAEASTAGLSAPGHDLVNPMVPRPIDPNKLVPRPQLPDPLKMIPRPGETSR